MYFYMYVIFAASVA